MDVSPAIAPCGTLRAAINLGNPVLARGAPDAPGGVSVDIALEVARRLRLPVEFTCFSAARDSFAALASGAADLGFLAIEPARAEQLAFTAPYVRIDGVFAVPTASPIRTIADVDRPGVRIGVKLGSAYDLFLTRTLRHATPVRGDEGSTVFLQDGLDVAAGIGEPMAEFVATHPALRLLDEPFMQIAQAVAIPRTTPPAALTWLDDTVRELVASGFVAASLAREE